MRCAVCTQFSTLYTLIVQGEDGGGGGVGEEPSSSGLNTRRGTHLTQPEIQLFPPPWGGGEGGGKGESEG
jgi:hypothetical protein